MISATVNISGSFLDTATTSDTESVKKCFLASAETLSGGKVIVVTGTTDDGGGVTIDPGDPGVSARFGTGATIIQATGGRVAATCCIGAGDKNVKVRAIDGTSTYTLLMWQAD